MSSASSADWAKWMTYRLPHLAAELLAEQIRHVGLVVDDQNADAHTFSHLLEVRRLRGGGQ